MKPTALTAALICLLGVAGCSTRIEERPTEIVEASAERSIEEAGGNPADWRIEGSCVAQGHCRVDVYAKGRDRPVASNSYVVKDSRATVNGTDKISTRIQLDGDI